jgi:hypothetical protein
MRLRAMIAPTFLTAFTASSLVAPLLHLGQCLGCRRMPLFPSLPDHLARAARSLIAPVVVRPPLGGAGARRVAQSAAGGVNFSKVEKEAYMTEDLPVGRVEPILNRLLELLHDKEMAKGALDRFKETEHPPSPPEEFANLRTFLEFHERNRKYKKDLSDREARLSQFEEHYEVRARGVLAILPESVPLHYEYTGDSLGSVNTSYIIVNRQGQLIIESRG